jgi:hypothetical protein
MRMRVGFVAGWVSVVLGVGLAACGSNPATTDTGSGADGRWEVLHSVPLAPRSDATAVWSGEEVVVFGGIDLEAENEAADHPTGPPETALTATTSGASPSGPPPTLAPPQRPSSVLVDGAAYDPAASSWRTITPAPVPDGYAPKAIGPHGDRLTVLFGRAFGCAADDPAPDPAGAWYDAAGDTWSTIPVGPFGSACAPTGNWADGRLWVFDGQAGAVFDPAVGTWEPVPVPMANGWGAATIYPLAGDLVALGSVSGAGPEELAPSFSRFDVERGTWSDLAPPPLAVAGPGVVADGRLYVYDPRTAQGASWDPAQGSWSRLPDAPLRSRTGNATVAVGDRLVVWGGVEAPERVGVPSAAEGFEPGPPLRDGASYDPRTGSWIELPEAPIDGRMSAAMAGTDDQLFTWGGQRIEPTDTGSRPVSLGDGATLRLVPNSSDVGATEPTEASPTATATGGATGSTSCATIPPTTHPGVPYDGPPVCASSTVPVPRTEPAPDAPVITGLGPRVEVVWKATEPLPADRRDEVADVLARYETPVLLPPEGGWDDPTLYTLWIHSYRPDPGYVTPNVSVLRTYGDPILTVSAAPTRPVVCDASSGVSLTPVVVRDIEGCGAQVAPTNAIVVWEEGGDRWHAESRALPLDELLAELATWRIVEAQNL